MEGRRRLRVKMSFLPKCPLSVTLSLLIISLTTLNMVSLLDAQTTVTTLGGRVTKKKLEKSKTLYDDCTDDVSIHLGDCILI